MISVFSFKHNIWPTCHSDMSLTLREWWTQSTCSSGSGKPWLKWTRTIHSCGSHCLANHLPLPIWVLLRVSLPPVEEAWWLFCASFRRSCWWVTVSIARENLCLLFAMPDQLGSIGRRPKSTQLCRFEPELGNTSGGGRLASVVSHR